MGLGKVVQACLYYLLTAIGWIFNPISTFILSLWYDKSATVIPLVEDDILLCSGTVLADKIRSREVGTKTIANRSTETNWLFLAYSLMATRENCYKNDQMVCFL